MTSRQCEKLVQEAFPVAPTAETIRTQALAVRSQESLDSATRVMEWYLKNAQVEVSALRQQRDELAERVRELEVCSDAVEILEEIEAGDPVFDDAKAFALAVVQKHRALEETNRELADALQGLRRRFPREYRAGTRRQYGSEGLTGNELEALDALLRKAGRS